jgi:hypothetical protein
MLHTIEVENQCLSGGHRSLTTIELTHVKAYEGSRYAGVTTFGDIALVYNKDGSTMLDLYICTREGLNGSGVITSKFEIDTAPLCLLDQITTGDIMLGSDHGVQYILKFAPIDIEGTDRISSLCQQRSVPSQSDKSRNSIKDVEVDHDAGLRINSSVIEQ